MVLRRDQCMHSAEQRNIDLESGLYLDGLFLCSSYRVNSNSGVRLAIASRQTIF